MYMTNFPSLHLYHSNPSSVVVGADGTVDDNKEEEIPIEEVITNKRTGAYCILILYICKGW